MTLLREYIFNVLLEGRLERVKNKFPYIPDQYVDLFAENDPSGNLKYLEWMVKHSQWGLGNPDDPRGGSVDLIIKAVNLFDKNLPKIKHKDINFYKSVKELYAVALHAEEQVSKQKQKKHIKQNAIKLWDDDNWFIMSPTSHKTSCYYGAGTKWCITEKDPRNWQEYYDQQDINFIFARNKNKSEEDPMYKIAIALYPDSNHIEIYNAVDHKIYDGLYQNGLNKFFPPYISSKIMSTYKEKQSNFLQNKMSKILNQIRNSDNVMEILDNLKTNELKIFFQNMPFTLEDWKKINNNIDILYQGFAYYLNNNPNLSEEALLAMNQDIDMSILSHPSATFDLRKRILEKRLEDGHIQLNASGISKFFNNAEPELIDLLAQYDSMEIHMPKQVIGKLLDEKAIDNIRRYVIKSVQNNNDRVLGWYYLLNVPYLDVKLINNLGKVKSKYSMFIEWKQEDLEKLLNKVKDLEGIINKLDDEKKEIVKEVIDEFYNEYNNGLLYDKTVNKFLNSYNYLKKHL